MLGQHLQLLPSPLLWFLLQTLLPFSYLPPEAPFPPPCPQAKLPIMLHRISLNCLETTPHSDLFTKCSLNSFWFSVRYHVQVNDAYSLTLGSWKVWGGEQDFSKLLSTIKPLLSYPCFKSDTFTFNVHITITLSLLK